MQNLPIVMYFVLFLLRNPGYLPFTFFVNFSKVSSVATVLVMCFQNLNGTKLLHFPCGLWSVVWVKKSDDLNAGAVKSFEAVECWGGQMFDVRHTKVQ